MGTEYELGFKVGNVSVRLRVRKSPLEELHKPGSFAINKSKMCVETNRKGEFVLCLIFPLMC